MSAVVFSGAAQFTALAVMDTGGGLPAAALAALLMSTRAVPMGLAAAPALSGNLLRRALGAQLVVDESWAVGQAAPGRWDARLLVGAGVVIWVTWLAGTVLGTLGADLVSDPRQLGLDVAFPALFLALLAPHIGTRRSVAASGASALLVLALIPVAPPGIPILAAGLVCLPALIRR